MRVAIVTESFLPVVNGVSNSVLSVVEHLVRCGHEPLVIAPGAGPDSYQGAPVVRFPALALPVVDSVPVGVPTRAVDPGRGRAVLRQLRPDRIEVSDRLTLRGMGRWAVLQGVTSVVISHERLDRLLHQFLLPGVAARRVADWANRRMVESYDTVVCTTRFAREEFDRIGSRNVVQVPLGVDLDTFAPSLSPEKHVQRCIDTIAERLALHLGEPGHKLCAPSQPKRLARPRGSIRDPVGENPHVGRGALRHRMSCRSHHLGAAPGRPAARPSARALEQVPSGIRRGTRVIIV